MPETSRSHHRQAARHRLRPSRRDTVAVAVLSAAQTLARVYSSNRRRCVNGPNTTASSSADTRRGAALVAALTMVRLNRHAAAAQGSRTLRCARRFPSWRPAAEPQQHEQHARFGLVRAQARALNIVHMQCTGVTVSDCR